MNRLKGMIVAGTLTGLILITVIVLSIRNANAAAESVSAPVSIIQDQPDASLSGEEAVQAWQTYSTELENTIRVMQDREGQYQTELEAANATILDLQDQLNNANQTSSYREHEEHEEHEDHEDHEDND
jgi:predicted  nucleic acid-binding Zn-ribbon protein